MRARRRSRLRARFPLPGRAGLCWAALGVEEALGGADLPGDGQQVLARDAAVEEVGALALDRLARGHLAVFGQPERGVVDLAGLAFQLDFELALAERAHGQVFGAARALRQ